MITMENLKAEQAAIVAEAAKGDEQYGHMEIKFTGNMYFVAAAGDQVDGLWFEVLDTVTDTLSWVSNSYEADPRHGKLIWHAEKADIF